MSITVPEAVGIRHIIRMGSPGQPQMRQEQEQALQVTAYKHATSRRVVLRLTVPGRPTVAQLTSMLPVTAAVLRVLKSASRRDIRPAGI